MSLAKKNVFLAFSSKNALRADAKVHFIDVKTIKLTTANCDLSNRFRNISSKKTYITS